MRIALIADELTTTSLQQEADVKIITPRNYKSILNSSWRADFLFVESAWKGKNNRWKYGVASFPELNYKPSILKRVYRFYHQSRGNVNLQRVVEYAKSLAIPTVFWNKEDSIHYDRFKESAKLFDHIFTVDSNCIPKYKEMVDSSVTVNSLLFAIQPSIHYFKGFNFKYNSANFVGSYSHHIHNRRREWQDMMFQSAINSSLGLTIYDRNSDRGSRNYRYPNLNNMEIKSAVPYSQTADIYRDHLVSLNVNTIEDSPTMFSRRLIEIIACGGIAVTNPTLAVEEYFKDYCYVVHNEKEMDELFHRLKYGASPNDMERMKAGAEFIAKEHTWRHRLEEIMEVIERKYH
jgi:spore maturation protein CgeB